MRRDGREEKTSFEKQKGDSIKGKGYGTASGTVQRADQKVQEKDHPARQLKKGRTGKLVRGSETLLLNDNVEGQGDMEQGKPEKSISGRGEKKVSRWYQERKKEETEGRSAELRKKFQGKPKLEKERGG